MNQWAFSPNHCFVLKFNYLFFYFTAIMRSFSLLQEAIIPYIPTLITQLTQKLLAVSKVTASFHRELVL